MKKIFATLLMLAVMLTSTVVFAAFKDEISEGVILNKYHTLAVALPMHFKTEAAEPTPNEFINMIYDAGKVSKLQIIPYGHIADNIIMDTGIDIISLQDADARRIYNENIGKYADAYVLVTTANNIKKTQFFFEVFDAKTGDLIYNFTLQGGGLKKTSKDYGKACENFYRQFDIAAVQQIKDMEKAKKESAKAARKSAKKNK